MFIRIYEPYFCYVLFWPATPHWIAFRCARTQLEPQTQSPDQGYIRSSSPRFISLIARLDGNVPWENLGVVALLCTAVEVIADMLQSSIFFAFSQPSKMVDVRLIYSYEAGRCHDRDGVRCIFGTQAPQDEGMKQPNASAAATCTCGTRSFGPRISIKREKRFSGSVSQQ